MKRKGTWILLAITLVIILLLFLPLADRTSDAERVIVDHTLHEIVHPSCFDQADLTNYIDEVSYSRAVEELGYSINDKCSEERLQEGKESVISKIINQ